MAPAASHIPHHICHNYPLCTEVSNRSKGHFCLTCSRRPVCKEDSCQNPRTAVKSMHAIEYCTMHLRDPRHDAHRPWPRCKNAIVGCRHLSTCNTGGTHCYACSEKSLPCINALNGCPNHVRDTKSNKALRCCTVKKRKCEFQSLPKSANKTQSQVLGDEVDDTKPIEEFRVASIPKSANKTQSQVLGDKADDTKPIEEFRFASQDKRKRAVRSKADICPLCWKEWHNSLEPLQVLSLIHI